MNESINPIKYTRPPHSARHANRRVSGPTRPRVTTRQITHTRVPSRHPLVVSLPTPRRRARRSIASRARVAFVVVVVDRVRVRVARTNEYTNENLHVPSTPRVGARRRRPRENERKEIRRSTNPRSTIRALDATARGAESAIDRGDAIARDASDARDFDANESMRPNERWGRSIESSRRLANASRSNDARDGTRARMHEWTRAAPHTWAVWYFISATHGIDAMDEARPHYGRGGCVCRLSSFGFFFVTLFGCAIRISLSLR